MSAIIHHSAVAAKRKGIALLAVLCIIMAITVLSLGFLARTDTELACGENMTLRTEMDQLAASGLEHARGLILRPQEATSDYWTGGTGLQLDPGSRDSYDVVVAADPNDRCVYSITSDAYRSQSGLRAGESRLSAQVRLDPAFALWLGANATLASGLSLCGDVYCGGNVSAQGTIDGDMFAAGTIVATCVGQKKPSTSPAPVVWPFQNDTPAQVINAFTTRYPWESLASDTLSSNLGTAGSARVFYRNGNLGITGGPTVNGMLIVQGNLTIRSNAVSLIAAKNLPAVYVTGDLNVEATDNFHITGLAVVDGKVHVSGAATRVGVSGALFVKNTLRETTPDVTIGRHDGILYGLPTRCAGRLGAGALQFDGTDDYVESVNTVPVPADFTVSLWVNADGVQNASATLLSIGTTGLALTFSSGQLIAVDDWPSQTGISLNQLTGGWHHVALVVTSDWLMAPYLDGAAKVPPAPGMLMGGGQATACVRLGTNGAAAAASMYKGLLDEVRIYGQALTPADIAALAAGGAVGASPLARWRFDETGAQMAIEADPVKAAIVAWPGTVRSDWSPAAGAFFKQVSKVTP